MSISFSIDFRSTEIAAQRRLNRLLRWLPRLSVVGAARRCFVRALLRAGEVGADRKLRAAGLEVARRIAGRSETPLRMIHEGAEPIGIVLDFHGGAWAFGSAKTDDLPNTEFARAGALVLAPDYRLALPRSVEAIQAECADVLEWLLTADTPQWRDLPVVVVGESAGSHLALSAMILVRDRGVDLTRVRGLLLHCGAYDLGGTPSALSAGSDCLVLHGPTLSEQMELLTGRDADARRLPPLSPLHADLSRLPPTLLMVGDIDPLRDDSVLLAEALQRAGGRVELAILPAAPHAVIHLPGRYADRVRVAAAGWAANRLALSEA